MGVHVGLAKPEIMAMLLLLCTSVHIIQAQNGHCERFLQPFYQYQHACDMSMHLATHFTSHTLKVLME